MNLAELIRDHAHRSPGHIAVTLGEAHVSYGELWAESTRLATVMADRGVGVGDRVLLYADNCPEHFTIYIAAARLGAIFAPVHSSFKALELAYVFKNSRASILFVEDHLHEQIRESHELRNLLPESVIPLGSTRDAPNAAGADHPHTDPVPVDLPADAAALISYTSGSTSHTPTPVTRSHEGEIWNAVTYTGLWDITPQDRVLVPLPLSWVYGLSTVGLTALSAGATVVLQSAQGTEPLLPAIQQHRISVFAGTMTMYTRLLAELQECTHDHSSLRRLYVGGESVVLPIMKLIEHHTGIRPLQAYATTEVAPVLAVDPRREAALPEGTVGRLVGGSEIRLVDPHGHDVPDGQVGEAWLRGTGSMLGYWDEPALTASRVTEDGWYRSSDFLWRDRDGYYFMVGRSEDVIIREGARVALAEVEAAITDIHGIDDAVVVAVPDEEFGEAVIAFVVSPGPCVSIDTIYDELGARIARFKLPREIYVLKEFPLGFTGKRDRQQLRMRAQLKDTADDVVITMADWLAKRSSGARG